MAKHFRKGQEPVIVFICLALLLSLDRAAATSPTSGAPVAQAQTGTSITYANGDNVQALAIDDNYLWAGTEGGGIVRWDMTDGSYLQYLYPQSGIASNNVTAIAIDGAGKVWIGIGIRSSDSMGRIMCTSGAGISIFDGNTWTTYTVENTSHRGEQVTTVTKDTPAGSYRIPVGFTSGEEAYAGLPSAYVMFGDDPTFYHWWCFPPGGFIQISPTLRQDLPAGTPVYAVEVGLASNNIYAIATDTAGQLWIGTEWGLSVFDGDTWTTYNESNSGLVSNRVHAIAIDGTGEVWIGTQGGVSVLDGTSWTSYTMDNCGLASDEVNVIVIDGAGRVWFGTSPYGYEWPHGHGGGVTVFDGDTWTTYNPDNSGLAGNAVLAIAIDSTGKAWFATFEYWCNMGCGLIARGISAFDGTTWTTYDIDNSGLASNNVRAIVIDGGGKVWFGSVPYLHSRSWEFGGHIGGGVSIFDGTAWTTYTTATSGLACNYVPVITIGGAGEVWFGTFGGASKFDGTAWTTYNMDNSGLASNDVRAMAVDGAGNAWFGTPRGVSRFDGRIWITYNTDNSGLASNNVSPIAIDGEGKLWFGTRGGGVSVFDGTTWTTYTVENTSHRGAQVTTITEHTTAGSFCVLVGFASEEEADAALSSGYVMFGNDPTVYRYQWYDPFEGGIDIEPALRQDLPVGTPVYAVEVGLASNDIYAIATDTTGKVWIGPDNGVSVFDGVGWATYPTIKAAIEGGYSDILTTINKNDMWTSQPPDRVWTRMIWAPESGPESGGVSVFDGHTWMTYTEDDGLGSNDAGPIAIDRGRKVWCGAGGVNVFDGSTWTTYDEDNSGLVCNGIGSLAIHDDDNVWIGTGRGVSEFTPPAPPASLPDGFHISVARKDQRYPALVYNRAEAEYLVVWQERREGGWSIYGRRVSGADGPLGVAHYSSMGRFPVGPITAPETNTSRSGKTATSKTGMSTPSGPPTPDCLWAIPFRLPRRRAIRNSPK